MTRPGFVAKLFALVWLMSCLGCTPQPAEGGSQVPDETESTAARDTSPDVSDDTLTALVEDNTEFAFELYRQICAEEEQNVFFSPHSISTALAMTYAGAGGETATEMGDALNLELPEGQLHPAFNSLDLYLSGLGEARRGEGFKFVIANALWGQSGFEFLDPFLDVLKTDYGAKMHLLDFRSDPEAARKQIVEWIEEKTEGKIKNMPPPGSIDELTRLVLANAIYFLASWAEPFEENQTRDEPFYLLDGGETQVPMMHQTETFGYCEGDDYQAVELPYDGGDFSMIVVAPNQGEFASFESNMSPEKVEEIITGMGRRTVALGLPRFELETFCDLKPSLKELGMRAAFNGSVADFSAMSPNPELYITDVLHKAYVSVDEEGTEAAAATTVTVGLTAMRPQKPVTMTVDRPFVFLIQDRSKNTVLFLGRMLDPGE